jgi:hypothetical protein
MRGKCPIAALPDQIYERLSNDNEHPFTSLDEIAGLSACRRTGRARAGPRSRIIVSLLAVRQRDSAVDPGDKKGP